MNLGRIGLVTKGAFVLGTVYKTLDVVSNDGNSYISRKDNNTAALTDLTSWQILANRGADGTSGGGGSGGFTVLGDTIGNNLFSQSNVVPNFGIVYNTTSATSASSSYDFVAIPVNPNTYYSIMGDTVATTAAGGAQTIMIAKKSGTTYTAFTSTEITDAGGTVATFVPDRVTGRLTVKIPNLTGEIYLVMNTRFTSISSVDTLSVKQGTRHDYTPPSHIIPNKYAGRNIVFFGDSTMVADVCNTVKNKLGLLSSINYGSSGSDSWRLRNIIKGIGYGSIDYLVYSAAVIYIGFNGGTAGTVADVDGITPPTANTMWGNIGASIEHIQTQNPNCRIYLCVQHYSARALSQPANGSNYQDTFKAISDYYSIPLIDVLHTCGINKKNLTTYCPDGTHFNTAGAVKVGEAITIGLTTK